MKTVEDLHNWLKEKPSFVVLNNKSYKIAKLEFGGSELILHCKRGKSEQKLRIKSTLLHSIIQNDDPDTIGVRMLYGEMKLGLYSYIFSHGGDTVAMGN